MGKSSIQFSNVAYTASSIKIGQVIAAKAFPPVLSIIPSFHYPRFLTFAFLFRGDFNRLDHLQEMFLEDLTCSFLIPRYRLLFPAFPILGNLEPEGIDCL